VWDYYNPNVRESDKKREAIYRIKRIVDPEINKLIKKANMKNPSSTTNATF